MARHMSENARRTSSPGQADGARRWVRVLVSLVAGSALVLACCLVPTLGPSNIDDWVISLILSGRYPVTSPCLFVNPLVSYLAIGLGMLLPQVNCFILVERVVAALCLASTIYLVMRTPRRLPAVAVLLMQVGLLLPGCTYHSNFTFVSAMALTAGMIQLLYCMIEVCDGTRRAASPGTCVGAVLVATGCAFRYETFLMAIPFLVLAALWLLAYRGRAFAWKSLVPLAIAFAACGVVFGVHAAVMTLDPGMHDWDSYNTARSNVQDWPPANYEENKDELGQLGISQTDYAVTMAGMSGIDHEHFTRDAFVGIREATQDSLWSEPPSVLRETAIRYFAEMPIRVAGLRRTLLLLFLVAALRARGKDWVFSAVAAAGGVVIALYFYAMGRLPDRVEVSVYVFAATVVLAMCQLDPPDARGRLTRARGIAGIAMVVALGLVVCLPVAKSLRGASLQTAETFNSSEDERPHTAFWDYEAQHEDQTFIVPMNDYHYLLFGNYPITKFPTRDMLANNLAYGGWWEGSPAWLGVGQAHGVDANNIARELVQKSDSVRLVSREQGTVDLAQAYIREHYAPNGAFEEVDAIPLVDGETMRVYRFRS